jgi:polygalacturonase
MISLVENADTLTWWPWKASRKFGWNDSLRNQLSDRETLLKMSDEKVPVDKRVFGEGHYLRPNFVQFINCKNILIDGHAILRSPMWELNPVLSSNITIKNVTITSPGSNNDGFDPESCKDVLVDSCFFRTGDDCIAIKS